MDGIQPYQAASANARPLTLTTYPANPAAAKAPSDYVRALRRRVWMVLLVAVPLSIGATIWAVRQPSVYRVTAQITIDAPDYDPILRTLLSHDGGRGAESNERYVPSRLAYLKSKALAEIVVNDPALLQGAVPSEDAADDLIANLTTKTILNSNAVLVSLDGRDAARTTKMLETLLQIFKNKSLEASMTKTANSRTYADGTLTALQGELVDIEKKMGEMLAKDETIGPDGSNVLLAEFVSNGSMLMHKKMRLDEVQQQAWVAQLFPKDPMLRPQDAARLSQIDELQRKRKTLQLQLKQTRAIARNDSDPSIRNMSARLNNVLEDINALTSVPTEAAIDPSETIVASMREEIRAAEQTSKALMGKIRTSSPEHAKFLALKEHRENKLKRIREMQERITDIDMLTKSQDPPVIVPTSITEPTAPIKPRRTINIAIGIIASFGLGIALVCMLEHLDHSVKVPEHLSHGLTLPLLGVVPRIRRTALTHRGGHLWAQGAPGSVEADAYRNLRASLLGASDRIGPIVTLLVTSAKAGEGKSTTSLNLAATCAKAGERTLLMDVDLRRPSLRDVFQEDGNDLGLVDVLRGELPWQRTVVRTDLPNLDFLPTGDARNVPIEILGALELRQLLIGLASHYDRVILDGPAVLGMADCRMLGRVVDAALLVVKSGTHEMRPLQRAKSMLEQSHVVLAGVVFNGLHDDLENWSSYGPYQPYGVEPSLAGSRAGRLGGPSDASITPTRREG